MGERAEVAGNRPLQATGRPRSQGWLPVFGLLDLARGAKGARTASAAPLDARRSARFPAFDASGGTKGASTLRRFGSLTEPGHILWLLPPGGLEHAQGRF